MDDQPRCGKGLAEHATLPAKIGELAAAMAALLEFHKTTLDLTDENARKEHDAYSELAKAFRGTATTAARDGKANDGILRSAHGPARFSRRSAAPRRSLSSRLL